jgi:hypothetical protein
MPISPYSYAHRNDGGCLSVLCLLSLFVAK